MLSLQLGKPWLLTGSWWEMEKKFLISVFISSGFLLSFIFTFTSMDHAR